MIAIKNTEKVKLINAAVQIYCDGACSGNPGPGGWGAVLLWKQEIKKLYGAESDTTNNRMELTAVIMALEVIKHSPKIEVYTDSMYLKNGITQWIKRWKENNWRTKGGSVKNIDLWTKLDTIAAQFDISWHWIKAHSGNTYNEMADALARGAIAR